MFFQPLSLTTLLFTSSCSAFSLQHPTSTSSILNQQQQQRVQVTLYSSTESETDSTTTSPSTKPKKLTLLTFDLDDTLYPMSKVAPEANAAFAKVMTNFGYDDIGPLQIVKTEREIRARIAETDPEKSACLTHTEIRRLAIREEMEKMMYQQKLERCAEDWATQVSSLSPLVVENAKT